MKLTTENIQKKVVSLSADDVRQMLPDENFEWNMYRDYRDEIDTTTFKKCMPELSNYKNDDGSYKYDEFVSDWKLELENQIWDWNWDFISDDINRELKDMVEKKLKDDGVEFDRIEFDFYPDDLYSVNLDLEGILKSSKIVWNLCRFNNFDGFTEGETEDDGLAIAQFLKLYPNACGDREKTKKELEKAVNECMYTGSDLKLNFRNSMWDFLEMLSTGKADACGTAVLHLGINGSGSTDFEINCGEVELDKQVGDTVFDHWTWQLDGHYGVSEVYGGVLNDNY